ncbi:MipA/OmpV family protein [Duganella phyllosphaerae]|uniref:MltA-interacting protein n=1 Tax=Duganella phyllosphaerae TaxID=762836 RepID=A0A1E7W8U1_9BURK|nr:MipA/OmpV family protein [Duganella phyllosphaerae]OEZ92656.1 MltA-interacting protein precursor [Duganella phyllosphaerae]
MRFSLNFNLKLAPLFATLCAVGAAGHAAAQAAPEGTLVGIGIGYVPEYAGADDNHFVGVPIVDHSFGNGFFASTRRGLGYQTAAGGFGLSAALTYGGKRDEHKRNFGAGSDDLRGMGNVSGGALALLTATYKVGTIGLSLSTAQALSRRENGSTYTIGASTPFYTSATDQLSFNAAAVYGDNKHAQTYYGVTAAQSARSGYGSYRAERGFENINVGVSWNHAIDARWSVTSAASATRLVGDAADSPLTKRKTTPMVTTGLVYKF